MNPTAPNRKIAILWVGLNLILSNAVVPLLPANLTRFLLGMWLPALTAIAFTLAERRSLKVWLNLRRGDPGSYFVALLVPAAVGAATVAVGLASGHLVMNPSFRFQFAGILITGFIWIASSLGEEIGWRGYLQSHLAGARLAPLWIGLIWGAWHFRQVWTESTAPLAVPIFFANVIWLSFFFSWLARHSSSVFTCAVAHGFWNLLRMKILFGNPEAGAPGLFSTDAPRLTDMEGKFGLLGVGVCGIVFAWLWLARHEPNA